MFDVLKIIWDVFNRKNMGDYHDHYLKKDVLLLAVFEKFIDTCLQLYGLDPRQVSIFLMKDLSG